ncbi:hypothetical protein N7379_23140 [Rhizobium pusense]|uniref:hypothetical protein n=1 Tax=Agrobacterium pusense TaxID=648995 RepID=UPI002448CE87|nr:hypothetical protein [Agrobacterium pusense]MDH0117387.1 hypothetical protein [Agrobacterium pusense]
MVLPAVQHIKQGERGVKAKEFSKLADLIAGYTAPPAKAEKKLRRAANDNKPAPDVLAWPALERLAYRGDLVRVKGLQRWRDLRYPDEVVVADEEGDYEPEFTVETRPSEAELLNAVGRNVIGRERWPYTGEKLNVYDDAPEPPTKYTLKQTAHAETLEARIGGLTFADGALKYWGVTTNGRKLKPVERRRGEKGGAVSGDRSESAIWSYIRLKGAVSPLASDHLHRPFVSEQREPCEASPEAIEARQALRALGVDGSVPFERLPAPATRGPDALVVGPQWVGGVKKPKPTASKPAGREFNACRSLETEDFVEYLVKRLGKHAEVLDLAIGDASAQTIGTAMGLAPAYAEKRGVTLIEAAIDALNAELRKIEDDDQKIAA